MAYTIAQIAEALGAKAFGASDIAVTGAAEPAMFKLAAQMAKEFAPAP